MAITLDQLEGLGKQIFIVEHLINGLFPCQSDVVRLIRSKRVPWRFNDKFEYRMFLAGTNTGGSLNSQVFNSDVSLIKPGDLEYGIFYATYGTVSDGFSVDMTLNLETKEKKAAFENDYATRLHSLRMNVAALAKNFLIHGKFGVVHQLCATFTAPTGGVNPAANTGATHTQGKIFTIKVPINVFNSNFKQGKYLIKTKEAKPWGAADVGELYMVLDNQPGRLTLMNVGNKASEWKNGEFLEVAGNREIANDTGLIFKQGWAAGSTITVSDAAGTVYQGKTYAGFSNASNVYTSGVNAVVGAMEGYPDLFPWYTTYSHLSSGRDDTAQSMVRLGLDLPFRGQPNRTHYTTEQAGGWIEQLPGEHIIDTIMRGVFLTKSTVPYSEFTMMMNPVTRLKMGYEEGSNVQVIRDNLVEGPIVYQRGVKTTSYHVGNKDIHDVVEDMNLPTDVIIIGPKSDMSYNSWDNSMMEIDNYIHETWGNNPPPDIEQLAIPQELIAKMDLSQRITYGAPTMGDGRMAQFTNGNKIRHPKIEMPLALHEMGAIFTENPYAYTICKLREPIADLSDFTV